MRPECRPCTAITEGSTHVLGLQLVLELAAAAIKTNTSEYFLLKVCEITVKNFQLLKPSKLKLR
jgi:hypothetical protein